MTGGRWWQRRAGCGKFWGGPEETRYGTRLPERRWDKMLALIETTRKRRLTWFGNVTRMKGNRLPVAALYGQVEGTRSRERQPKKWMDIVREDLMAQGMNMREAVDNSRNRMIWRSLVEVSSSAYA